MCHSCLTPLHVARRTWLRGLEKINKRYQIHTAARNLGLLMRDLFGIGKPRVLQDGLEAVEGREASLSPLWLPQIAARWFLSRRESHPEWHRPLAARRLTQLALVAAA